MTGEGGSREAKRFSRRRPLAIRGRLVPWSGGEEGERERPLQEGGGRRPHWTGAGRHPGGVRHRPEAVGGEGVPPLEMTSV